MNQADSEIMQGILNKAGYEIEEDGDLIIINTCTVKDQTIKNFKKFLEQYKDKKVILAGCIAQTQKLDYSCVGTDQIHKIVEVVEETLEGNIVSMIKREKNERLNLPKIRKNDIIEIIPICQGCLDRCSFCQTKAARGHLYSYSVEGIVKQMKNAIKEGAKEIWLTSQDNGAYGKDIGTNLCGLLKELLKIEGEYKIRIGMGNPNHLIDMVDEIFDILQHPKMFKFIHIPVQSGNNQVLKDMNRRYTVEQFIDICNKLKGITLATDIIVGFPTETEEQFLETLNLVNKIKFDVINISKYSARPNTPASKMKQLHQGIINDRSKRLTELFKEISLERNEAWNEWQGEVLIDDTNMGRNFAYKPIVFDSKKILGETVNVKVKEVTTFHLKA